MGGGLGRDTSPQRSDFFGEISVVATKNQSCLLDYSPQNKYGTQEWFGLEDDFLFKHLILRVPC